MGFWLRGGLLRLQHTAWTERLWVCAGGLSISLSLVSPTCFHSFGVGSGGKFEPEGSAESDEDKRRAFPATFRMAMCLVDLVGGILSFPWSCLSLSDLGGRIKDFNFKKKKELAEHKDDTVMSAKRHNSSHFLHSILNSHNVLNSQVWWKLQVFGHWQDFCFIPSSRQPLQRCSIILIKTHRLIPSHCQSQGLTVQQI